MMMLPGDALEGVVVVVVAVEKLRLPSLIVLLLLFKSGLIWFCCLDMLVLIKVLFLDAVV